MAGRIEVWQGALALMALKALQAAGPLHGNGLARQIEATSRNRLAVNCGLTLAGQRQLAAIQEHWKQTRRIIGRFLGLEPA